jgi:hypothetical protein
MVKPDRKDDKIMEYTGVFKQMYSHVAGENVSILKYKSKDSQPYCNCSRCGKPIKRIIREHMHNLTLLDIERGLSSGDAD